MGEETDPGTVPASAALKCPKCGAPLLVVGPDGYANCAYCGVRSKVSTPADSGPLPSFEADADESDDADAEPEYGSEDSWGRRNPFYIVRVAIAIVGLVVVIVILATSSTPATPSASGPTVGSCSVAIEATATSGPAPFTATFTANVTTPPGDYASEPMWQFGPFTQLDVNFTYGSSVSHTWNSPGTYGVHVSVPDSSGQGCWTTTTVDVA